VSVCGETPRRLADDRVQVVAALVRGEARAAADAVVSGGSLLAAASLASTVART
jgi:hypothetical protein